ncbi:MAG: radical SAM protein [Elusimicrobiota bacterium]
MTGREAMRWGLKLEMEKNASMLFIDPSSEVYINIPNISLAYAATHFKTRVIDQHILPYPRDRFLRHSADVLGISVRSFALEEAKRIADIYTAKYPSSEIKSVSTSVDVQCCYPFLDFDKKIVFDKPFSDEYPFPDYELFDSFNYLSTNWQTGLWNYSIMTSVGCPYQCTFCACRSRKWHARSAKNSAEELKRAQKEYNIVSFEIIDDAFNVDKDRVLEFCGLVKPLKLRWLCSNGLRADRFDEESACAMASAGCDTVGFGIESTDDEVLALVKKGETIGQIEQAVEIAKKYFKEVKGYFILGLPGSNYEKDIASIEWARKQGVKPVVSYYVPVSQPDKIFYGEKASASTLAYPEERQKEIYRYSKKITRGWYYRQGVPAKIMKATFLSIFKYNFNSLLTHFIIGPKRFLSILFKGEVQ